MIADQNFYDICVTFFYPTASATAYGQRPKFVRAEHSATAEGENCAYGPTLLESKLRHHFTKLYTASGIILRSRHIRGICLYSLGSVVLS